MPGWPDGTVVVLVTQGRSPHAIPVSAALRGGPKSILHGLGATRDTHARLRRDPAVAVLVLAAGDLAFTAYGSARVLDAPVVAGVVAVRVDVERLQDHMRATIAVDSGVGWRWTDPAAERRDADVRAALHRIAGSGQ
jgi:hypothetical protein